jgi:hypothetical protein
MVTFKLIEKKHKFYLSIGFYRLYLGGVFSVNNIDLVDIGLTEMKTQDYVTLKELNFKTKQYINGIKAIACYEFEVMNAGDFEIEFDNIENLELKSSSLFLSNFLFPSKIDISDIQVIIQ